MNEPTPKLQQNADELLREFPPGEPDFEAQAKAIEARLKDAPSGALLQDLLNAPELAAEPGEPALPSAVRAASAPKSNFAEMARKSLRKEDDPAELARELVAATAQVRRPDAEMVERVRAAARAAAVSTPLPTTDSATEEAGRASGVIARAANTVPPAARAANQRGIVIGIAGGLLALAACVALFLKSGSEEQLPAPAAVAAQKANDAPPAADKADAAAAAAAAKANDGVLSPEALAAAPPAAVHDEAKAVTPKAAAAAASKPAAAGPGAPQAVVLEDDPLPQQPAQRKNTPTPEPQLTPAQGDSGSVPLNPSGGAVGTALGAVRSGAQACLAGQTAPVTAVVTFAADGHVLHVSAAGPSGACIQAALSKAHIAPFAKDSFTATTMIRPP